MYTLTSTLEMWMYWHFLCTIESWQIACDVQLLLMEVFSKRQTLKYTVINKKKNTTLNNSIMVKDISCVLKNNNTSYNTVLSKKNVCFV